MPEGWPLYPGAATTEAAGSDAAGCRLRVVSFISPVSADEVLSYYAALARSQPMAINHRAHDGSHLLSGANEGAAFRLSLRARGDGTSEGTLALWQR
jgi:hypothetical protein